MNDLRAASGRYSRRGFLQLSAASVGALACPATSMAGSSAPHRLAYAHGAAVPPVGMGTWLTFDVATDEPAFASRRKVLDAFFEHGGGMIDSSPMYGKAERAVGELLDSYEKPYSRVFSATKIWTVAGSRGPVQLANSHALWKHTPLDLVYVHNLLRWEAHLKTLRAAKEDGRVRYIGLTTSHGRRHDDMERLIRTQPIDCVQLTYNILDREAERRLLPAAADHGAQVVINRPFQGGGLFQKFAHQPLPAWAPEAGCVNWAEFFLKFILSHPAVDVAIPATTRADHMAQNMRAGLGAMPNAKQRNKMVQYVESL